MNRLAIKIKEARLKAKMSEKDLAKACGQNVNYILQIESGKKVINEQIAENILKILGEKIESFHDQVEAEKPANTTKAVQKPVQPVKSEAVITPNDQWTDVLKGIIKSFPVADELTGKPVEYKELSVLSKKIENIHFEKIAFVKVSSSEIKSFRIKKDDVLTLHLTSEIQNHVPYYVEVANKKSVKVIYKSSNNKVVLSNGDSSDGIELDLKDVKIIGKVIKVEFSV